MTLSIHGALELAHGEDVVVVLPQGDTIFIDVPWRCAWKFPPSSVVAATPSPSTKERTMASEVNDTKTWPELAAGLYDKLTGRGAEINDQFDNLEVEVPSKVVAERSTQTGSATARSGFALRIRSNSLIGVDSVRGYAVRSDGVARDYLFTFALPDMSRARPRVARNWLLSKLRVKKWKATTTISRRAHFSDRSS